MVTGSKNAVKAAAAAVLGTNVVLPAPYAEVPCPVRYTRGRPDGAKVYVRVSGAITTRSVVGNVVALQIDVFGIEDKSGELDANALADVAAGQVVALFTGRAKDVNGSLLPPQWPWVFTDVREDASPTLMEDGPDGEEVTHNVVQFQIRAQDTGRAPDRF